MGTYRNAGLFVLLSFLWGTSFMAIKAGLEFFPPVLFAAFRYDIAGVVLLGYAAVSTDYWRPRTRADWLTVFVGSTLIIALYNGFLFIGQQGVTSGVAAILIAMNPILATGFSRAFLPSERLAPLGVVGLLLGFVGVGIVSWPTADGLLAADVAAQGFVLLAAVCVALGSVLVQRVDSDISTVGMVAWSNALGAVVLHGISIGIPSESLSQVVVSTGGVLALGYLAVLASAVGYVIYFDLLGRLGAIEINLVSYAVPMFAALSGWLVLGETLEISAVLGFVIISAGFVLLKREAIAEQISGRHR